MTNCANIISFSTVCVVGDMVYEAEQPVTADQPCLKCKCQPPGVHCETTRCLKKPGCRAIHKPNKCCPDYQCGKFVRLFLGIITPIF